MSGRLRDLGGAVRRSAILVCLALVASGALPVEEPRADRTIATKERARIFESAPLDVSALDVSALAPVVSTPPALAASPASPSPPPARPKPFAMDLYRDGAFVSQATASYCIPASMLTMMNMIDGGSRRSASTQRRLYALARKLSTWRLVGEGAEAEGWARALDELGFGPYVVHVADTRTAAIMEAARAIRTTGRPVGLMIWRGAHSWVMSGFKATADPATTDAFKVTHVNAEDPWYPRVSSIWGASRRPDSLVPVKRLSEDFLAFRRPTVRYPDKDGRFVLVLPIADAASAASATMDPARE